MADLVLCAKTVLTSIADALRAAKNTEGGYTAEALSTEASNFITNNNSLDATATSADLLYEKTAYAGGEKITGTIVSRSSSDLSSSGKYVYVPSGYYSTSASKAISSGMAIPQTYWSNCSTLLLNVKQYAGYISDQLSSPSQNYIGTLRVADYAGVLSRGTTYLDDPAGFIKTLGWQALCNHSYLYRLSLPNCSKVSNYACQNCYRLSTVYLPYCKVITTGAFSNCSSLSTISLPICSSIGNSAFYSCSRLISVTLGSTSVVTLGGSYAFSKCTSLLNSGYIYVPASLLASYQTATNWTYFSSRLSAIPE